MFYSTCININLYKDRSPFLKYNSICDSVINANYNLSICNITNLITIGEKIGAMHELVNIEKIKGWVNNE